jgi:hypothetical protein
MGAGAYGSDTHQASFSNLVPNNGVYHIVYDNTSYLDVRFASGYLDATFYSSQGESTQGGWKLLQAGRAQ